MNTHNNEIWKGENGLQNPTVRLWVMDTEMGKKKPSQKFVYSPILQKLPREGWNKIFKAITILIQNPWICSVYFSTRKGRGRRIGGHYFR